MTVRRITKCAVLAVIAVIAGIIENLLPPVFPFAPGVRLGLANVVITFALVTQGLTSASVVMVVKMLLVALFSGNIGSLMYSAPAGIISLSVSFVGLKLFVSKISVVTVSCASAITHNAVQLIVASIIAGANLTAILPLTLVASIIAGYGVGLTVYFTVKKMPARFLD